MGRHAGSSMPPAPHTPPPKPSMHTSLSPQRNPEHHHQDGRTDRLGVGGRSALKLSQPQRSRPPALHCAAVCHPSGVGFLWTKEVNGPLTHFSSLSSMTCFFLPSLGANLTRPLINYCTQFFALLSPPTVCVRARTCVHYGQDIMSFHPQNVSQK